MVGLVFAGIIAAMSSLALLKMGRMIDVFPDQDESERDRSMWSPVEFTRIFVGLFWVFFGLGSYMIYLGSRVMLVFGIATVAGILLFLVTALVFSVATFNLMRTRTGREGSAVSLLGSMKKPVINPAAFIPDVGKKPYHGTRRPSGSDMNKH